MVQKLSIEEALIFWINELREIQSQGREAYTSTQLLMVKGYDASNDPEAGHMFTEICLLEDDPENLSSGYWQNDDGEVEIELWPID